MIATAVLVTNAQAFFDLEWCLSDSSKCVSADNVDTAFDKLNLDFDDEKNEIPILVKRSGKFGENKCEQDDEHVWVSQKDACYTDK